MKSNDTQCDPKITDFIGEAESEMPRGVREKERKRQTSKVIILHYVSKHKENSLNRLAIQPASQPACLPVSPSDSPTVT